MRRGVRCFRRRSKHRDSESWRIPTTVRMLFSSLNPPSVKIFSFRPAAGGKARCKKCVCIQRTGQTCSIRRTSGSATQIFSWNPENGRRYKYIMNYGKFFQSFPPRGKARKRKGGRPFRREMPVFPVRRFIIWTRPNPGTKSACLPIHRGFFRLKGKQTGGRGISRDRRDPFQYSL